MMEGVRTEEGKSSNNTCFIVYGMGRRDNN